MKNRLFNRVILVFAYTLSLVFLSTHNNNKSFIAPERFCPHECKKIHHMDDGTHKF